MKKWLALGFSLVLCLGLLAGCAQKNDSAEGTQTNETQTNETATNATTNETQPAGEITFTAYVSDKDAMYLVPQDMTATKDSAEAIVEALAQAKAIPEGSQLLEFSQDGKSLTVDMNATFGEGMSQSGTTGEYLYMGSLVNTLLTHYEADSLTLTVEGKVLETGHSIYNEPLAFYKDPS